MSGGSSSVAPGGGADRRRRLFPRGARGADQGAAHRLHRRLGHPQPDPPRRRVAARQTMVIRRLFAEFLSELVRRRPDLEIRLLLWDYSLLYATERELFPTLTLRWNTPRRIPVLPRRRRSARLVAAPEADRDRRCGCLFRRARRDHAALGHAVARAEPARPRRSRRQTLCAVPRRAGGGRRRRGSRARRS